MIHIPKWGVSVATYNQLGNIFKSLLYVSSMCANMLFSLIRDQRCNFIAKLISKQVVLKLFNTGIIVNE